MPRPQRLSEDELVGHLAGAFRRNGYEGTSLAALSAATGMVKAALYHRFPAGKAAMAEAVEAAAGRDFVRLVIAPLRGGEPPAERIAAMADGLMAFYAEGRNACLVEIFSIEATPEPIRLRLQNGVRKWIAAVAAVLVEAGVAPDAAGRRAEGAVIRVQGALVVSRALADRRLFLDAVAGLVEQLLPAGGTS